ncbi:MAG: deoxyguanosinetriphosphate triphosphohydrolase [Rickettsiales bacterium]|nr:deoxyguanosinetriphosphate triphosphohydrolase [Rickettsiales bacterium]
MNYFADYESVLAPYACLPSQSRGRLHAEPESVGRSVFQRDRDRIIHSAAFRRLEYKTQVFVNHEGDHYRTRLTHSLEVAQLTRSLCRRLHLNEDLGETLALSHDLGHTPFGHAGEDGLQEVMAEYGGFSHNAQAIRILTHLENRYALFDGLNLTWETLEGIAKHNGPLLGDIPAAIVEYQNIHDLELHSWPGLEAQIAALCDDIAYHNHDIEDGIRANLFELKDFIEIPLIGTIIQEVDALYPNVHPRRCVHEVIRRMINRMAVDLERETLSNIKKHGITHVSEVRAMPEAIAAFSSEVQQVNAQLKDFLMQRMYRHYTVNRMASKARRLVKDLFKYYHAEPECLPTRWRELVDESGDLKRARIVADFIAGMTDRFAIEEHQRLHSMEKM